MAPEKPASKKILRFSLCTLFWVAIAAMFAGLFGWAYTHWDACKGKALYLTNTTSCLEVGDGGVFANEHSCVNECDAQLHKSHTDAGRHLGNSGRRRLNDQKKIFISERVVDEPLEQQQLTAMELDVDLRRLAIARRTRDRVLGNNRRVR